MDLRPYLPEFLGLIRERLSSKGIRAYLVGGCVRDLISGRSPSDWDLVVDSDLRELKELFPDRPSFQFKGMVFTTIFDRYKVEFCSLRGSDLLEDLGKRDFTMNSLALDLSTGKIHDPFGGLEDLKRGILKTVGDPRERFGEDPLRMLRAVRFVAQLDLRPEREMVQVIMKERAQMERVAVERIREELKHILLSPYPYRALWFLFSLKLLKGHIPELWEMKGVKQSPPHRHRVLKHSLLTVNVTPPSISLRLAALFHDIAKPKAHSFKGGRHRFFGHHILGAQMAEEILKRLRFPRERGEGIVALVRHHLLLYSPHWTDKAILRFLERIRPASLWELLSLRRADLKAQGGNNEDLKGLDHMEKRAQVLLREGLPKRPRPPINGQEIMELLGIGPGPMVGKVIRGLEEWLLRHPEDKEAFRLKRVVKEIYSRIK